MLSLLLICTGASLVVSVGGATSISDRHMAFFTDPETDLALWTHKAWNWLMEYCPDCPRQKNLTNLYYALPTKEGRLSTISADNWSRYAGLCDAVIVIDAYPHLRPGHGVHLFLVDFNASTRFCKALKGFRFPGGECMITWSLVRCYNEPRWRGDSGLGCTLRFIPEVRQYSSSSRPGLGEQPHHGTKDLLVCDQSWGGPCPQERGPIALDRCGFNSLASHRFRFPCEDEMDNTCRHHAGCNKALLLNGGWNRRHADRDSFFILKTINDMLLSNHFSKEGIKIFYANGLSERESEKYRKRMGAVYPARMKLGLRRYVSDICREPRCARTFFVYLNSPATEDGDLLMWDWNSNAQHGEVYEQNEVYQVEELIEDISNCKAERLILVVDQAFYNKIVNEIKRVPGRFQRTLVIAPESPTDSRGSLVSRLGVLTSSSCLADQDIAWSGASFDRNTTVAGSACGTYGERRGFRCWPRALLSSQEDSHEDSPEYSLYEDD